MQEDVYKTGGQQKGKAAKGKKFLKVKDGHSYEAKHVYPLQKSYLEGVDVFVPQAPQLLLAQEYKQHALKSKIYRG
jgi:hypothetical protein